MKISIFKWLTLVLVAGLCVAAYLYSPLLPDPVPTHWNIHGEADDWTAKPWGVWMMPIITAVLATFLLVLPSIAPGGFRLDSSRPTYDLAMFLVIALLCSISLAGWESARGGDWGIEQVLPIAMGVFFIVLGNYLAKFPKNFFVGIRTPWTLASDEVWTKTHRLGGWLFMLAGAVVVVAGLLGAPFAVLIGATVVAALVPALYSLWLYRRIHGFNPDPDH